MRTPLAAATDAVAVTAFATIGRASHDEALGPLGVAETAWPFWAGAAAGWILMRAWRRPTSVRLGLGVWGTTVIGGMLLRAATGAGVQPSFVVVTAIVLGIFLLGWRAISSLLTRPRTERAPI